MAESITIHEGDVRVVLPGLPSESVNACVTSPPYWGLRDYGVKGQLGLERTPEEYIAAMVGVFREVRRILRKDGTLWLNMGDSYNAHPGQRQRTIHDKVGYKQSTNRGSCEAASRNTPTVKAKDLVGVPWMLAFALRSDGWYLRCDIIWHKPNPMPESVTDRPTRAHEYLFLLSKSHRYYYHQEAIAEPVSQATHARLSQNVQAQIGSARANGGAKTNGNMKAVGHRPKAWDNDMGSNQTLVAGHPRKLAESGSGAKNNSSFDAAMAIMPEKRNKRSVWTINTQSFFDGHFATFPEDLIKPCILAGCPAGGTVLDPFFGSGTTGLVARANDCRCIGIELNPGYIEIARRRLAQDVLEFA